jgi:preprotein translocase subunit SecD
VPRVGRYGVALVTALIVVLGGTGLGACGGGSSDAGGDTRSLRVVFDEVGPKPSQQDAERAASIIEHRLRKLGVDDARVVVNGSTLVATGTGIAEGAAHATKPGLLDFRPVVAVLSPSGRAGVGTDRAAASADVLPAARSLGNIRYAVGPSALSGTDVRGARAQFLGGRQAWVVTVGLTKDGARKFNDLAGALYAQPPPRNSVAIALDGVVLTAPAFQEPSFSGDIQISGQFTKSQAKQIAVALQTGALPMHVQVAPGSP